VSGKAITDRKPAAVREERRPLEEPHAPVRRDRRAERREATVSEILDAAWDLVHEQGLSALSLRDLGERVGMRAQSLYSYFDSKYAIYDAMFQEANEALLTRMEAVRDTAATPEQRFRLGAREFADFALEDAQRSQLLFLRTLPGFEPSPAAYAPAVQVLDLARDRLADLGITRPELLDIWTATLGGLVQQQLANDPGGTRWRKLLDDVATMYLAFARGEPPKRNSSAKNKKEAPR
jgi:AcrR family transcriptional regulator